jgi:catechol 2,3-dioxygenase-like lactoylglutathione lyase family enzyme
VCTRMAALAAGALLLAAPGALAQQYTGTYAVAGQGGTVTLTLRQAADGQLTGTMTGNGVEFRVEGIVEEGVAMGAITNAEGGVFFEASLDGAQLTLTLVEVGAGNMPDYSKARTLVLQRGAGPVAGGGGGGAPARGVGGDGLIGRWACQTGQGTAQLAFLSGRELELNGERTPYQVSGGTIQIPGDWGPVLYQYRLDGDRLAVTDPAGGTMQCQRQAGGVSAGTPGGGREALLQGLRCAYSSSPDGGFSTLYKLYFDGQGRFTSGSESSFSGDPGSAHGLHNDPNAGTYRVTGNSKGAEIHLTFPDGSTGVAYVYFVDSDNGRILELQLNRRLYAAALCQ